MSTMRKIRRKEKKLHFVSADAFTAFHKEEIKMGIRWNIDHMNKSFFLNDLGKIEEVKNVFYENKKINLKKIIIGSVERKVSEFSEYFDYNTSFDDIQLPTNPEARDLLMQKVLQKNFCFARQVFSPCE